MAEAASVDEGAAEGWREPGRTAPLKLRTLWPLTKTLPPRGARGSMPLGRSASLALAMKASSVLPVAGLVGVN